MPVFDGQGFFQQGVAVDFGVCMKITGGSRHDQGCLTHAIKHNAVSFKAYTAPGVVHTHFHHVTHAILSFHPAAEDALHDKAVVFHGCGKPFRTVQADDSMGFSSGFNPDHTHVMAKGSEIFPPVSFIPGAGYGFFQVQVPAVILFRLALIIEFQPEISQYLVTAKGNTGPPSAS